MSKYSPLDNNTLSLYECEAPHYSPVLRHKEASARYECQSENRYVKSHAAKNGEALICCVGDMLCEEKLYNTHKFSGGFFFDDIFSFVRPVFSGSDLVIGNLETTVCESSPYTGEQYKIDDKYHCNAPVEFLDAIKRAGFDCLVMSNNHNCDSGVNGILETIDKVEQRGMMHTGVFGPDEKERWIIVDVNGIKIGLLSYSTWFNRNQGRFTELGQQQILNEYKPERAAADIKAVKEAGAEFVVVYMHWGIDAEYMHQPSQSMKRMAQELADCGADYIVGSHTHSVQPHDVIISSDGRSVPCVFSMGNFATSEYNKTSRSTAILLFKLRKTEGKVSVVSEEIIPCYVPDSAFGINYPIIPSRYLKNPDEGCSLIKNLEAEFNKISSIFDIKKQDEAFLTTDNICRILGVAVRDLPRRTYTTLNFAMDARKDGVAVINEITSDPSYRTSAARCRDLAEIAISKGAALLISPFQIKEYPCVICDDVFDAYCRIIKECRSRFNPFTVSITGSIGKTTSTEMMYSVLSNKYNTHRNTGSANNVRYAGTVIQQLKPEHEAYVQENMEGPPYGAASTIAKMVRPNAAICTVVGTSHLEVFGTQERILESCLGVQDGMPEDGLLVLNGDDPFQWNAQCKRKAVYYAIDNEEADYRAVNIHGQGQSLIFDILYDGKRATVSLRCFGKHNVLNALAAFAVGIYAGMSEKEIIEGLGKYRTSGIRQNLVSYGGYKIFLDCYNAAPESIQSALDSFEMIQVPDSGRRIAVLADVKEIGERAEEMHRRIGKIVAASCVDLLICYGENAKFIADVVKEESSIPVYHTESPQNLLNYLKENVTRNDVTLFKGSHGMALEHIVDQVWGTWFHEEFEQYDFLTHFTSDRDLQYRVYTDHVAVTNKRSSIEDVVIPDFVEGKPVTSISRNAFNRSKYTKSIQFSNNLVNIRYCAFYKADNIESVHIPSSVRVIDDSAFSTCEKLKTVVIEPGCMHLGYRAFGNCKNLESITIPETVKQIGSEAFINCDKLTIYGARNSYAEQYAAARKINFADISRAGL